MNLTQQDRAKQRTVTLRVHARKLARMAGHPIKHGLLQSMDDSQLRAVITAAHSFILATHGPAAIHESLAQRKAGRAA